MAITPERRANDPRTYNGTERRKDEHKDEHKPTPRSHAARRKPEVKYAKVRAKVRKHK